MHLLSPSLVESLFARLIVSWGQPFLRQYEGIELAVVQADWAEQLAGFELRSILPDEEPRAPAIEWALGNLPDRPLNVIAFRALCSRYTPPSNARALGMRPRPVPPQFREAIAKLAAPPDDDRPESVRVAYRYIERFGAAGAHPTPRQKENLKHYRRITEKWEAGAEHRAKEKAVTA